MTYEPISNQTPRPVTGQELELTSLQDVSDFVKEYPNAVMELLSTAEACPDSELSFSRKEGQTLSLKIPTLAVDLRVPLGVASPSNLNQTVALAVLLADLRSTVFRIREQGSATAEAVEPPTEEVVGPYTEPTHEAFDACTTLPL